MLLRHVKSELAAIFKLFAAYLTFDRLVFFLFVAVQARSSFQNLNFKIKRRFIDALFTEKLFKSCDIVAQRLWSPIAAHQGRQFVECIVAIESELPVSAELSSVREAFVDFFLCPIVHF